MTLHQVTNTIFVFKDKFYSLTCSVLHANSKENSNVNRESLKESFKYGTQHALLAKALIISAIYSTFQLLARDNANLNCSLFLTLQRKQTYFENKYSSQHPLGSRWWETSIYYFINSSSLLKFLHNWCKSQFTINNFKYHSYNMNPYK